MNKRILILLLFLIIFSIILNHNHNNKFEVNRIIYLESNNYTLTEYLRNRANNKNVKEYENGNKQEMYAFEHESTDQVDANIDYRYIGLNPNNYIYFNCTDDNDTSTCEVWRILGVFEVEDENGEKEERVKIVHDTTIGQIIFDENGSNNYGESTLKYYLNEGEYYNSISDKYKDMIATTKYYLGSNDIYELYADDYYSFERNDTTGYGSWTGKIGLLYTSDYAYIYGYGVSECNSSTNFNDCSDSQANWLINTATFYYVDYYPITAPFQLITRTITPFSDYSLYYLMNGGRISGGYNGPGQYGSPTVASFIKPTLYLKKDVGIASGDGTLNNPYILKLLNRSNIEVKAENGNILTDLDSNLNVLEESFVGLSLIPADGYELESLKVTDESGTDIDVINNKFKMPSSDVTIRAIFKKASRKINIFDAEYGTISILNNQDNIVSGDIITLNIMPYDGYELESLKVTDESGKEIDVVNNEFEMPGSDVTIRATFKVSDTIKENINEKNPKTYDNIYFYIILLLISINVAFLIIKKQKNYKI